MTILFTTLDVISEWKESSTESVASWLVCSLNVVRLASFFKSGYSESAGFSSLQVKHLTCSNKSGFKSLDKNCRVIDDDDNKMIILTT